MSKSTTNRCWNAPVLFLFFVVLAQSSTALASADLSLSLTGPASAEVASTGHFEAILTNLGPDTAANAGVTITLPPQIEVHSYSSLGGINCSFDRPFVCTVGDLAAGETGTVKYTASFVAPGSALSTAEATADSADANSANNTASLATEVTVPEADLTLTAEGPASAAVGEVFGYKFLATNNGPGNALSATVDYMLPPEVELDVRPNDSGIILYPVPLAINRSCADSTADRVICRFEPLRAGDDVGVIARVKVIGGTSITNVADVSGESVIDPDSSNNTATVVTTVVPTANLALDATSPSNPIVGEQFNYVFTVTNSGPEMATNVAFNSDPLPPEVTFVSVTPDNSCTGIGPISCNLGNLASGSSASVTITVDANAAGLATAGGVVSSDLADGIDTDNSASSTAVITGERLPPGADVSVSLTGPASAEVASTGHFEAILTNLGPDTAANAGVTITLPPQIEVHSYSSLGGINCSFDRPFVCTVGDLAAGETGTVKYTASFVAPGSALSTAEATADSADANSANNTANLTTEVAVPEADLALTAEGPATTLVGEVFGYKFLATNNGPGDALSVTVDYMLPPEVELDVRPNDSGIVIYPVPVTTAYSCADSTADRVICRFEPLRAGDDVGVIARVKVIGGTSITNVADVSGEGVSDPDSSNNTATVVTTIVPPNRPPVADDQSAIVEGLTATAITLTGSDPDGDALSFTVTAAPAHGTLSGVAPNLTYTSDPGFLGADSFTFVANDGEFDSDSATVSITVIDTTPPDLTVPADITQEATGTITQVDVGVAAAADLVDGIIAATNDAPLVGFPLGTTIVTWTATDNSGNESTATQRVTVVDTTATDLAVPANINVECNETGGVSANDAAIQAFLQAAVATDIVDPQPAISNNAPILFPAGPTDVTFTASDFSGNSASAIATITVNDTTSPELSLSVSPRVLWPPNHNMIPIDVTVAASDICDPKPIVELTLVTSSEGDGVDTFDPAFDVTEIEGRKGDDIQLIDGQLYLRAERAGNSAGRIYTITYKATDSGGNSSTATATVEVPHNQ